MDILAIVAGAITLACKIASGLNSILIAPREVELVREEVRSSSSTLQAVQAHFNPQSTSYTPVQLQHLLHVTTGTKTTLNSLDELIDKIKTPRPFGRIRWTACIDEVSALRLYRSVDSPYCHSFRVSAGGWKHFANKGLTITFHSQRGANIEALVQRCLEILECQYPSTTTPRSPPPPPYTPQAPTENSECLEDTLMAVAEATVSDGVTVRQEPWIVPYTRITKQNQGARQSSADLPGQVNLRFIKDNSKHKIYVELLLENGIRLNYDILKASSAYIDEDYVNPSNYSKPYRSVTIGGLVNDTEPTTHTTLTFLWHNILFDFSGRKTAVSEILNEYHLLKQLPQSWFRDPIRQTRAFLIFLLAGYSLKRTVQFVIDPPGTASR